MLKDKGHVPVDIANIEDLTVLVGRGPRDFGVASLKFDSDGSLTEIGAHGEVCNCSDQGDCGGDIVEDTVVAGLGEGQTGDDECRDGHDGSDSL